MSLVAYEASSDEDNDNEDSAISKNTSDFNNGSTEDSGICKVPIISSEEFTRKDAPSYGVNVGSDRKYVAKPVQTTFISGEDLSFQKKTCQIPFSVLPLPKLSNSCDEIIEEDDEFLHKKDAPPSVGKCAFNKGTVKISIASLSEFKDIREKKKKKADVGPAPKSFGLLNLLPKPRHERIFSREDPQETKNRDGVKMSLVPDSVKNRQGAASENLQNVPKAYTKKFIPNCEDSGDSDSDDDFFSLNTKHELPEVSLNEINSMVARKAAEMADVADKFKNKFFGIEEKEETTLENAESEMKEDVEFNEKALQALVGSRAKRRKVEVNILELSSEQVLPNKDEWLRTALAQATTYQPKGVLVDEEPAPGTRKKHQITYLAHQAKANEQELQAMWSANRHTRRQTQSKYGF